ncbi:hypothetical protein [Bradyrhizobium liaoningense]
MNSYALGRIVAGDAIAAHLFLNANHLIMAMFIAHSDAACNRLAM